jgi:hypothetical protein
MRTRAPRHTRRSGAPGTAWRKRCRRRASSRCSAGGWRCLRGTRPCPRRRWCSGRRCASRRMCSGRSRVCQGRESAYNALCEQAKIRISMRNRFVIIFDLPRSLSFASSLVSLVIFRAAAAAAAAAVNAAAIVATAWVGRSLLARGYTSRTRRLCRRLGRSAARRAVQGRLRHGYAYRDAGLEQADSNK